MTDNRDRLQLLEIFAEKYNEHDVAGIMECMAEDCVFVSFFGVDPWGEEFIGADAVRRRITAFLEDFPDARWDQRHHFVADDKGVSEWSFSGTKLGTGDKIERYGCDIFTFRKDKILKKDTYQKMRVPKNLPLRVDVPEIHKPIGRYSHAVRHQNLLFVSGCGPFDLSGNLTGEEDIVLQTEQTLRNMMAILKAAGCDFSHVLKETVYLTDIDDSVATRAVRQKYYGDTYPASTLIGVQQLAHPKMKIEIDAVAYLGG